MDKDTLQNDKLLFNRIATGDGEAFHELFTQYYDQLHYNALRLLKSAFWAEEIVQDVFLQVWDRRETLSTVEHPAGWLFRIVSFKCFDRIRRQELELRAQYAMEQALRREDPGLQHNYDLRVLRKLITEAVERLPEQQRAAYILKQEEGLSYKEIATRLNISPHTVHNHLNRAFQAVRKHIRSHGEFYLLLFYLLNA